MLNNIFRTSASLLAKQQMLMTGTLPAFAFSGAKFGDKLKNIRKPDPVFNVPKGSSFSEVQSNYGLNQFVQKVYKTTGVSVASALAVSQMSIAMGLPYTNPGFMMFGGFIATLGGLIGASRMATTQFIVTENGNEILKTVNSPLRLGVYGVGIAGLGMTASPMFMHLSYINPAILPTAVGLTSLIFGSASLYAYMQPKDSLLSWGKSLQGALFGIIGLQLSGIVANMIMGPNMFSHLCHRADTFIGLGVFSALVAYDTHVALRSYEEGNADHLGVSIGFVLDFWNILMRVADVLRMFSSD